MKNSQTKSVGARYRMSVTRSFCEKQKKGVNCLKVQRKLLPYRRITVRKGR